MKMDANQFDRVPVVILCGGKGVLVETGGAIQRINKGVVAVRRKPLFWWVMLHYAAHGATDFILATGYQSLQFREALDFGFGATPITDDPACYLIWLAGRQCSVRLVPTPIELLTGNRLLRCEQWLAGADRFCVAYSDTLSDVDLAGQMAFHRATGMQGTLVAAQLPVRFRILGMRVGEYQVRGFSSRPVIEATPINGGYYIFEHAVLKAWLAESARQPLVLETDLLERLTRESQLGAFTHEGVWQHFDCERDMAGLNAVVQRLESLVAGRVTT